MMGAVHRSEAGFSLVEILVVLSLVGLMSGLMLPMMGQFRNLAAADNRLTLQAALKKTAGHIASLLEQAESLPLETGADAPPVFLEATENSARFLAVVKSGAFDSGLMEIEIKLEEQNGVKRVVETVSARRAPEAGGGKNFELLDNAERLAFSYLPDAEAPELPPVWRAEWRAVEKLPAAVRVTLQARDKAGNPAAASAIARLH